MTPKQQRFYVYQLSDPRDGLPFYVGKGTGRRAYAHVANVRRGVIDNGAKCQRIAQILDADLRVEVEFLATGMTEGEAFAMERRLIAAGVGLTNISGGSTSHADSVAARIAMNIAAIKAYDDWVSEASRSTLDLVRRVWGDPKTFYRWYCEAWGKLASDPRTTLVLP